MPSGSHAGGGSSHSSGGSVSGGSSHSGGGGGFRGGPIRPYGRGVVIINNRPYRMRGGAGVGYILTLFLSVVLLFVGFAGIGIFTSGNKQIALAEKDYVYYQQLKDFALDKREQGDSSYIVSVEVDHIEYHSACGKWFLVYYVPIAGSGKKLKGWTYDLYTQAEANAMRGQTIEIALEKPLSEVDENTDSVPVEMPLDLNRDGDYVLAKSNKTTGIIMMVSGFAGFVVLLVLSIFIKRKFAKPIDAGENGSSQTGASEGTKEEVTYCEYCGARMQKDADKCPECGARHGK